MDYSIESFSRDDYLLVVMKGKYTSNNAPDIIKKVDSFFISSGHTKLLLDMRDVTIITDVFSEFVTFADIGQSGIARASKFAAISKTEYKQIDSFVETTNRNRGVNMAVFYSEEMAINWLKDMDIEIN